jgi:hypothetical protein
MTTACGKRFSHLGSNVPPRRCNGSAESPLGLAKFDAEGCAEPGRAA